jgi:hypothetical protein
MPVFVRAVGAMIALLVPMTAATAKARVEVDVNLVTALDTSFSVGRVEQAVEREGLARALVHPQLLEVVRTGSQGRVGLAVFTWSSHSHTKTLVPWTTVANAEDAKRILQHLLSVDLSKRASVSIAPFRPVTARLLPNSTRRILPSRSVLRRPCSVHPPTRAAARSRTLSAMAQATADWSLSTHGMRL